MKSLKNKVVIITGASSGIGKAIALRMGKEGAKVLVNYNSRKESAEETVEKIKNSGGDAFSFQADISKEDDVKEMFEACLKHFDHLDVLVNNSGIQKDKKILEMSLDDWNAVIGVNLTGHFLCAREAVKAFKENDAGDEKGTIIFITSVHERIPWSGRTNYTASKAGASMLMKSLALELAEEKIRVNAIAPGAIRTNINAENLKTKKQEKRVLRKIPYGRVGEDSDIAGVALWLCSDDAAYITGETIFVDGGMSLYPGFE